MPDRKLSQLPIKGVPQAADYVPILDPSEVLPADRNKIVPVSALLDRANHEGDIAAADIGNLAPTPVVEGEVVLFGPGGGPLLKRMTGTGFVRADAGVASVRTPSEVKGDIGLGNADNTADADKPVSVATQAALAGKQPLDADLTTIAGLTATTDSIMQAKGSAWSARTLAQVIADLIAQASFTEGVQDIVGALVAAAGGTYDDAGNAIALPGAWRLIGATTLFSDAANIAFSAIPQTYKHLKIVFTGKSAGAVADSIFARCNGDAAANYGYQLQVWDGTSPTMSQNLVAGGLYVGVANGSDVAATKSGASEATIHDYARTNYHKMARFDGARFATNAQHVIGASEWRNTAAITGLTVLLGASIIAAGSRCELYGIM